MKYKIRSIIDGLKNLWKWHKAIYRDRDWDHWYIYQILKTKMQFQADYMRKHGITESASQTADEIEVCIDMIDKVQNEYHIDVAIRGLVDEKWNDERFDEETKKHDELKKQLFQYLHDNIEKWWD